MGARGRTDTQEVRQAYRAVCRQIAIDALNAANYSETRHYADMEYNAEECLRHSKALVKATKEFRRLIKVQSKD